MGDFFGKIPTMKPEQEPNLWMIYERTPITRRLRLVGMVFAVDREQMRSVLPPGIARAAIVEDFGWIDTTLKMPTFFAIEANP
jgi:hypothetical protein